MTLTAASKSAVLPASPTRQIEDYALIGNTRTAALVGRDGSIDWLCVPHFDSAACFAALLGTSEHGRFLLRPAGEVRRLRRRYRESTLVLESDFESAEGSVRVLMIPMVGFLPPTDPRVRGTIEAIQSELMVEGLLQRYSTATRVDGLPPGEGFFLPCSFWLADNLALIGRQAEAERLFERLLSLRNDLGLIAEEYDPYNRRLLGNFPQAMTHVALINSARNLSSRGGPSEHRGGDGPVDPAPRRGGKGVRRQKAAVEPNGRLKG